MSALILDSNAAMGMAAEQDMQAQKRSIESLSKNQDSDAAKRAKLREACEGFESIFIQQMWEQMRASLPKDGLMSSSKEEQFWQGMYDQELAKSMSSAGGIGLADMMMEQMSSNISSASDASKQAPNRSGGLQISPAPLVSAQSPDKNAPIEKASVNGVEKGQNKISQGQVLSPQNGPLLASNIYEGEATQPMASVEESLSNASQNIDMVNAGQNNQMKPAPVILTSQSTVPQNSQIQNNQAPQQVAYEDVAQEPIVTKVTYQTNLPPNQRKAMPDVSQIVAMTQQAQMSKPAQMPQATSVSTSTQGTVQSQPVERTASTKQATLGQIAQPVQERDILAGITQSYIPTSKENTRPLVSQASVAYQSRLQPTRAGGPDLLQPKPIQGTMELGLPNPERGSMESPVEGRISSGFGWRLDPLTGKRSWHNGVDIPAVANSPVKAAEGGVVSFVGYDEELGNMLVIDHPNGLSTVYGHNGNFSVKKGDVVEKGTEIARVGMSGRAAGSHLHFEIRKADMPINPESVLNQGIQTYTAALNK